MLLDEPQFKPPEAPSHQPVSVVTHLPCSPDLRSQVSLESFKGTIGS
jgi:hypothetical protein